jgi:glucosamine--fructose-6-phosphate aminotransferase (isomerizing)
MLPESCAYIFVSQSGETSDTLKAQSYVTQRKFSSLVITNVLHSSMAKRAGLVLNLRAGAEYSVVSTKAFTAQLASICCLTIELLRRSASDRAADCAADCAADRAAELLKDLQRVPELVESAINTAFNSCEVIVKILSEAKTVLFIGRGVIYPIAMECALKLKEIAYIHAEGYPAGEMKHGPIALIDKSVVTVIISPSDGLEDKNFSSLQEIAARGGAIVLITDAAGKRKLSQHNVAVDRLFVCEMPTTGELSKVFVYSVVGQILAYKVATLRGCNADRPRNLAKSVTVE